MLQKVFLLLLITVTSACSIPGSTPDAIYEHAPGGALAAAVSVDSSLAVVSSVENGIAVWDMQTQKQRYQWRHQGEGNNLVASTRIAFDNSYVVTSDRDAFALWSLSTGEPEGFWRIDESSIRDIAVSNQGRGILVGRGNGKVMFFEPQSGRRLEFLGHQEKINSVDLSPNGFYALTGGSDFMAYLWDTRSGQVVYSFTHPSRVTKVALDFQGRYAFTADSKNNARIWDLRTGQQISKLHYLQRQKIFSAAKFSEDGKHLLTGSPSRGLSLWDVKSGDEVSSWMVTPRRGSQPQSAVVYDVAFMPGRQIMSHSSSGLTEIWSY
ncbi:WD40 repeat domain-containing protein [Bowmanella yangjiangensis]|uniref:PQQ-binding-like beta-propeller repeat protein n=1 Tax=Bowmanella yangjiangensis TaxID=2811230 RepID=A0ABS3CR63_9ALTE|nr:PQQ-binding-like beta-propeller repeat protein [Bowmanella yangjiangensis]MBN7819150.1 PQQ-binding-like beta-propeller repeat protein [Bowmanella yangjiangensis]